MESAVPGYKNLNFGQLSLSVRLSCDVNRVKIFKTNKGLITGLKSGCSPDCMGREVNRIIKREDNKYLRPEPNVANAGQLNEPIINDITKEKSSLVNSSQYILPDKKEEIKNKKHYDNSAEEFKNHYNDSFNEKINVKQEKEIRSEESQINEVTLDQSGNYWNPQPLPHVK